jgi:hypothetical protein
MSAHIDSLLFLDAVPIHVFNAWVWAVVCTIKHIVISITPQPICGPALPVGWLM